MTSLGSVESRQVPKRWRVRLYWFAFRRYRKAPHNSRRGDFWWWMTCKIESNPK